MNTEVLFNVEEAGEDLARALARLGYQVTRQTGSHIRPTFAEPPQLHLTIPAHSEPKAGTLSAILAMTAERLQISKEQLLSALKL